MHLPTQLGLDKEDAVPLENDKRLEIDALVRQCLCVCFLRQYESVAKSWLSIAAGSIIYQEDAKDFVFYLKALTI